MNPQIMGAAAGHATRLARDLTGLYGLVGYAGEELVGGLFGDRLEIGRAFENHAAYLQLRLHLLRESSGGAVPGAGEARRAVELVAPEAGSGGGL